MNDEIAATDADIARLEAYVDRLSGALGHAHRVFPFRSYLIGTMLPGKRKSIEPMSARLDPENVPRMHQKLQHFIATSPWQDDAVLAVENGRWASRRWKTRSSRARLPNCCRPRSLLPI